jgi:hypothetical protein
MVYGRRAYEGFAKAIGAKMGLKVQVEDGASACIDSAGVVRLPGMNTYQSEHEFEVTCGVVVHELAHQFYKSHQQIDAQRSRLEHDCLNAVLDVADETWVGHWFQRSGNVRPGELLFIANADALSRNWKAYTDWGNAASHAWKVLVVGILAARLHVRGNLRRLVRFTMQRAWREGQVDAHKCFRLIRQARRTKACNGQPTSKRFAKLIRLAKQLADLLKPFTPPAGAPAPAGGPGAGIGSGIEAAVAVGSANIPGGATEAGASEGASNANASAQPGGRGASAGTGTCPTRTMPTRSNCSPRPSIALPSGLRRMATASLARMAFRAGPPSGRCTGSPPTASAWRGGPWPITPTAWRFRSCWTARGQ